MDKNIFDILPNEIQDNVFDFVGYREEYNKVINELKLMFKINRLLNTNNQITTYYFNHYIYYTNDD